METEATIILLLGPFSHFSGHIWDKYACNSIKPRIFFLGENERRDDIELVLVGFECRKRWCILEWMEGKAGKKAQWIQFNGRIHSNQIRSLHTLTTYASMHANVLNNFTFPFRFYYYAEIYEKRLELTTSTSTTTDKALFYTCFKAYFNLTFCVSVLPSKSLEQQKRIWKRNGQLDNVN